MSDWVQVGNGTAAAVAAAVWTLAILPSARISGWASGFLAAATAIVCTWYALANLLLGSGLLEAEQASTVPLFRWAFAPLVLLPALRHVAQRPVRRELRRLSTIRLGDPESETP